MTVNAAALALEMALALVAADRVVPVQPDQGCCQECVAGIITHGDGHTTPCPCPANCSCKRKTKSVPQCETGSCPLPPSSSKSKSTTK